jgi:hypothetical protein
MKLKLKLGIKKIKSDDVEKCGKFNINNNTFTTFVKKTNQLNEKFIYTNFQQIIGNETIFENSNISVKAMVVDNIGRLYIGGNFNKIGNLTCNNVGMWDGNKWHNLADGLVGQVVSLCTDSNNNLYVGGSFDGTYYNTVKSKNIIMWNIYNKSWIGLDGGVDNGVSSIKKLSNGNIVIAGSFTSSVNSLTYLQKIAYWNGSMWINLGTDFLIDKSIYALAIDKSNNIYIGGYNNLPISVYNWKTNQWNVLVDANSNMLDQIINTIIINPSNSNPIFGGIIGNFASISNVFNVIEFDIVSRKWIPLTNSNGYGLDYQCFILFYDKITSVGRRDI